MRKVRKPRRKQEMGGKRKRHLPETGEWPHLLEAEEEEVVEVVMKELPKPMAVLEKVVEKEGARWRQEKERRRQPDLCQ